MDIVAALKSSTLFRELDRRALRSIASKAEWIERGGGQYLFRVGEDSDALYLVASGRIRVVRPEADRTPLLLGEIGAGDTVGEITLITAEPHSSDAYALRDTALIRISREVFETLVVSHPTAMLRVTRMVVDRLRSARPAPQRESVRSARTFAVVPAHPGVDVKAFAAHLSRELGLAGATLRLDAERVNRAMGEGASAVDFGIGERNRELAGWLTQLEERYRYIVYEASPEPDAWTRRCLRQADRILLIAHGDQRPFLSRNLSWIREQALRAPQEMVVLAPANAGYSPRSWKECAGASAQHRVQMGLPDAQMGRLARMVSGRAVCLVLGGGGARGFAHLGLIRAMQEKGIPIDAVGGTSMGAMVAAMLAMGLDAQQMLSRMRETFVTGKFLNDYSLSRISLISAEKFRRQLKVVFGERHIEDLELPFYCLSTNLTRGIPVVHDQGELATWVGASMAVPGIAPPIVHRGELLVDGGLLNAIPFDVMADMGRGQVIVSDVSREPNLRVEMAEDADATSLLSLGAGARHLNMFKILFHTATLTSERESRDIDARADLVLHMPVGGISMFDWDELDEIVYRAYHHADQKLDEWRSNQVDAFRARVIANRAEKS
ncbi:cyclic nucleotide-binding protein [Salinisphaera dokdonensis CL-ES53]|uniref:Cyclic nucleotide-binding protein n=1 Tax=Salinisphaera dokdonensis CL-ES53 TaxID=1304272 RepID=A0ABV2B3B6_9GAMM